MTLKLTGPLAIAHRGSRELWPENTMVAFQGAVDLGYRWLETDLHLSSDGVVMCIHDGTVDRTTDRRGPVAGFEAAELEKMDAGRSHRQTGRPGVPRLEEVLSIFPDLALIVDLKEDGLEQALFDLLVRLSAIDRVVVGSFSDRRLRRFRSVSDGAVLTSAGPSAVLRTRLTPAGRTVRRVADALQIPEVFGRMRIVDPGLIDRARQAGMATHVWTVNAVEDMNRLLDWGVDGIITDRPDLLRDVLVARGLWR